MISIVLYGRNDSYGYNLHKRAALSLNCMAEVLTGPEDEILFVDYNTPNDYPTFPEAIFDTLTERARRMIRIFRVRPEVHERRFARRTHLKALEPVARNVAVRRSNPANRWILSTNTDMIFVPRAGMSLTDLVAPLDGGFYCAPRFEIPESLWESFNRLDPASVIVAMREMGETFHLNEVVRGRDTVLYDAPGDFQLMRRADLFEVYGFEEDMVLGWHVDSNISRRLLLRHGAIGDAASFVLSYHCDHTRQITPAHAPRSVENSIVDFVDGVDRAEAEEQAENWGLAGVELEEFRLEDSVGRQYRDALAQAISARMLTPWVASYRTESYDKEGCRAEHVLPFLLDLFANFPRDFRIGWVGEKDALHQLVRVAFTRLGFVNPVFDWQAGSNIAEPPVAAFIVNFGMRAAAELEKPERTENAFREVIADEAGYIARGGAPRQIVAVNAIHNRFETLVQSYVNCGRTPFSTRLRHGYLRIDALKEDQEWTSEMLVGRSGCREGNRICSTGGPDHVFYGPYRHLLPGIYQVDVALAYVGGNCGSRVAVFLDVAFAQKIHQVIKAELWKGRQTTVSISLSVGRELATKPVEVRLVTPQGARVCLDSIRAHRLR